MNIPRTLDNEKLDKLTLGPIPQSLKHTAGRQDDDLVVSGLKPLINKVVSLMSFLFHWVSACRLVSLQAEILINFVMGVNRLLKTHCIPWWVDLFCQLTRCQDGDMKPCKHKNFIYHFHDNVYNLHSLWLYQKLIIVVLIFNRDFYLKNWDIFKNALLNSKLLAVHHWEKMLINSKLFTLQKNLTRVHLWGTFASHWRRLARVGYCGLSIKINAGIWLVGDTDTPWQWGVHGMETQFLAIFLLFLKKEPRHRWPITVQPCTEIFVLHVYKFWVTYPCERRSNASLKSENM